MKAIINGKIFYKDKILEDFVLCFDKEIRVFGKDVDLTGVEVIDVDGAFVSAGFIDLHIHGTNGSDVMDCSLEALDNISSSILKNGTTSFLATTMTSSKYKITKALENIRKYSKYVTGASVIGVHLEGPFINPTRKGAQNAEHIQKVDIDLIDNYSDIIKMITLAPEIEGGEGFIKGIKQFYPDMVLSIGHSDATYEQSRTYFGWGISHATHLFNAMPPLHHRDPGIVGAVFDTDVTCDIIPDLVHTHPYTLKLTYQMKRDKLIIITDSMRAGCMKSGSYDLGDQEVIVSQNRATLKDGTIAGSIIGMNDAIRNMLIHTAMSPIEAINAVTKLPAQKLGLNKGELKVGYDADIVVFNDSFDILMSIVAGEVSYIQDTTI